MLGGTMSTNANLSLVAMTPALAAGTIGCMHQREASRDT